MGWASGGVVVVAVVVLVVCVCCFDYVCCKCWKSEFGGDYVH